LFIFIAFCLDFPPASDKIVHTQYNQAQNFVLWCFLLQTIGFIALRWGGATEKFMTTFRVETTLQR